MNYLLILGAGFSRNWGGWLADEVFEYLLGCKEIVQSEYLNSLLWKHKQIGGFEDALAEVQEAWVQESQQRRFDSTSKDNLDKFQSALERMFADMNQAFSALTTLEFQTDVKFMVRTLLYKFDAIFTLNQDLLLETHYLHHGPWVKWNGCHIPGMHQTPNYYPAGSNVPVRKWIPKSQDKFKVDVGVQLYFKLHGSSEWRDGSDRELLILGGNKQHNIARTPVLKWYYEEFVARLSRPSTRLMVIGYSFHDEHINRAVIEASTKGHLQIFIIDPAGADVISKTNLTYSRKNNIYVPNELECALKRIIVGASRRSLREIFGTSSQVEHSKVMRFFC